MFYTIRAIISSTWNARDDLASVARQTHRLLQERHKALRLTTVSTVAEAIDKLVAPVDMVWLRLPLPDLQTQLFLDFLLTTPDLADRVGVLDPFTISGAEPFWRSLVKDLAQSEKWIWFRTTADEEREWARRLLSQCASDDLDL